MSSSSLGHICRKCGRSIRTHLQNPFGIRVEVETWSKLRKEYVADYFMCYDFMDDNDVIHSRDDLIKRMTS